MVVLGVCLRVSMSESWISVYECWCWKMGGQIDGRVVLYDFLVGWLVG